MKRLIAVLAVLTMITAVLAGCEMVAPHSRITLTPRHQLWIPVKAHESTEKSSRHGNSLIILYSARWQTKKCTMI